MRWKCTFAAASASIAFGAAAPAALAQADPAAGFPNRPLKLVVGFGPGGANDIMSRIVGQKLSERLGQPVVIENKPGAGGFIAAEIVARAPPDGYTLLSATSGTFVISPAVYSKLPYDPIKSFAPIGMCISYSLILVVDGSRGINSLQDLVSFIKANPDKANYAGSSPLFQLATELFMARTGTRLEYIPFKSSQESTSGVLTGQTLMTIIDPGPTLAHIKTGKLKLLANAASQRTAEFPDTPTLKELGVDMSVEVFGGLVTTAGTPPAIVKRLETELIEIRKQPDTIEKLKAAGMPVGGSTAAAFAQDIESGIKMWKAVAEAAKIKLD